MRILVLTEGTIIMHGAGQGAPRGARVQQVAERHESITDWAGYVPIGDAARRLAAWRAAGASILYLTSRRDPGEVAAIASVLSRHGFPEGPLIERGEGESCGQAAGRAAPDVLIEDDCESICGLGEMTYAHLSEDLRLHVKPILVREFGGIDLLPKALEDLLRY